MFYYRTYKKVGSQFEMFFIPIFEPLSLNEKLQWMLVSSGAIYT